MEKKELRIGNLVKLSLGVNDFGAEHKGDSEIKNFHEKGIYVDFGKSFDFSEIEPIPLTEDWLISFGFIIRDKNYSLNYGGESMRYAVIEKPTFVLFFHGKYGFNTTDGIKNGDFCIKHVHQLQNLYFALTGKELTNQKSN